jgi:regulator of sirC expression with transglutaminase-like and TPR domain
MKPRKTGGRTKGVPNKVTQELRQWLQTLIDGQREQFERDLQAVEPEKRLQVLERLLAYILPKPQSLDIAIEYRELERLLERTPEQYIERISARILELNTINKNENDTDID